jgi:PIN domain nuclease of toxin-antitoxin system
MTTLAVLDAHTLIWAAADARRLLGRRARAFIDRVEAGRASAYVPTIALVEIGEAVRSGRVTFVDGFERWTNRLASSGRYHLVDLTLSIVQRAHELYDIPERGDRLVAATAVELDCPVVTKDPSIAQAPGVDAIW